MIKKGSQIDFEMSLIVVWTKCEFRDSNGKGCSRDNGESTYAGPLNPLLANQPVASEFLRAAVTPQFNLSFSFVSRVSKHLIEFIAIES